MQNGWLVQTTKPYSECGYDARGDDMLVFTEVGKLGEWVSRYFGGTVTPPQDESCQP